MSGGPGQKSSVYGRFEATNSSTQTRSGRRTCTRTSIMPPRTCALCNDARAILKRPKTGQQICKECFFYVFETEVHNTITEARLFKPGDRVAIGASGGKGTHTARVAEGEILRDVRNRLYSACACNEDFE